MPTPLDMGILANASAAALTPSQLLNSMHGLQAFVDSRPRGHIMHDDKKGVDTGAPPAVLRGYTSTSRIVFFRQTFNN